MTATIDTPVAPAPPVYTAPVITGPLPGPRSAELLDRQAGRESNSRSYPRKLPMAIRRGKGSYVEDLDGNVFLDFLSGAGVLSLGHNHPEPLAAAHRQLDEFVHGWTSPPRSRTSSPS